MSQNVIWSSQEDEILIGFVRNHEVMYNVKCKDYRKYDKKQNLWRAVGDILEKSDVECSKRWTYIRDYYVRRKVKPGTSQMGEAARKRAVLLSFLDGVSPSLKSNMANVAGDDSVEEESETTEKEESDSSIFVANLCKVEELDSTEHENILEDKPLNKIERKRKISMQSEDDFQIHMSPQQKATIKQNELDETDHFFMSMAKIVKKLPPYERAALRMQISTLIGNAELRYISKSNE